ncbi:MAG: hypothetical protein ACI35P_11385 [Bacillus sp. (in: firmicutes)]
MAVKKAENKEVNLLETYWNVEQNLELIEKLEKKTLEAIEKQKEWIATTSEQLSQFETNSKQLTSQWKTYVQEELKKNPNVINSESINVWVDKIEEIGKQSQSFALSPAKSTLEILAKTQANFITSYTESLNQLQQNRTEFFKPFEGLFDQAKETQLSFLKAFEIPTTK